MKKQTMKDENIHTNHRKRLLEQIEKVGLNNTNDIQTLEFILTYIIPRKDTNPIAHRLLKRFGSLSNVLDASVIDLIQVEGIGERSAKMLTILPQIFFKYAENKSKSLNFLLTNQDYVNYCYNLLNTKPYEEFYVICLNKLYKQISTKSLGRGNEYSMQIDKTELINLVLQNKTTKYVVLTHNHPMGDCKPSYLDIKNTDEVRNILKTLDITLLDHFVVGNNGCYSINKSEIFLPNEN